MMYEPIVLRKKKPHSVVGTPAGKVNVIVNFILIVVPATSIALIGRFLIKKRRIIDELEGTVYVKHTSDDELMETRHFWKKYGNIVFQVRKRLQEKEQQLAASNAEVAETNS